MLGMNTPQVQALLCSERCSDHEHDVPGCEGAQAEDFTREGSRALCADRHACAAACTATEGCVAVREGYRLADCMQEGWLRRITFADCCWPTPFELSVSMGLPLRWTCTTISRGAS